MAQLRRRSEQPVIFCYAEGCNDRWEAFCPAFDLAVQGDSFTAVQRKLEEAVSLYLQGVLALPDEADRKRLLGRRAPLSVWASPFLHILRAAFTRRDDRLRHEFTMASPAMA